MTYLGQQRYCFSRPVVRYLQRGICLAALLLGAAMGDVALGTAAVGDSDVSRLMVERSNPVQVNSATNVPPSLQANATPQQPGTAISAEGYRFSEGRYLFGQALEPDEIGAVYTVFAVEGDRITGAFYMPHSSFDCFYGNVQGDRLSVTVRDSYGQTTFPYAIALVQGQETIASSDTTALQTGLDGFHRIAALSENDQRILDVCRSETW
ncbi:MAG: hypothetical protein WBA10_03545 [Elainellaceae cyanobacterium]